MRKKICFVTTLAGAIESFLLDLTSYMVEHANYDVTFICHPSDSLLKYTNEHIHYIPVEMKRGMSLDGLSAIWKLYKIFKREKFDIVQYSTKNAGTYAPIAAWMAGIKCRLYCQWGMMFASLKGWRRALMKLDEKIICGFSTVIEAESYSLYNTAVELGVYKPEKASVIWHGSACGVNLDNYKLENREKWRKEIRDKYNIPATAVVFGWCGRITRDKGHNELFAAFREINKTNKSARLMLVGDNDNAETIDAELFKWAHDCPEVIFTGRVPREDVSKYYSSMDVFCSLSYREGFGLVVIEAAAMLLPGIVTDSIGQIDTHENMVTGITVHRKSVDDVVRAMLFCINHPEKCKAMGEEARRQVEMKYEQKELLRRLTIHRDELIMNTHNEKK